MRPEILNNNFTIKNTITTIITKDLIKTTPTTLSINKKNTMLNLKAAKVFSRSKISQYRNLISKNLKKSIKLNKITMLQFKKNNNHNTLNLSLEPPLWQTQLQNCNYRLKLSSHLDNNNNTLMWIEKKWLWNKMLWKKKAITHAHFLMWIPQVKMMKLLNLWIIFVILIINKKLKLDLNDLL